MNSILSRMHVGQLFPSLTWQLSFSASFFDTGPKRGRTKYPESPQSGHLSLSVICVTKDKDRGFLVDEFLLQEFWYNVCIYNGLLRRRNASLQFSLPEHGSVINLDTDSCSIRLIGAD